MHKTEGQSLLKKIVLVKNTTILSINIGMRKNRQLQQGAVYHVTARINNKEMLLESKQMKILFQKILVRAKKKYKFTIENFVIMGNHYHIIIRPMKNESLSCIMQWIMSVFAMNANKKLSRTGHLWGERFYSRILRTLYQYLIVKTYIDENPISAGLVHPYELWMYSGKYQKYIRSRKIIDEEPVFVKLVYTKTISMALCF